jgi:hypothetical protein
VQLIDSTSAASGATVTPQQIKELPSTAATISTAATRAGVSSIVRPISATTTRRPSWEKDPETTAS